MKKGLALLPLLALLLVLAVGCGSRDALQLDPVASAAGKTTSAGSSRVAFELEADAFGHDVSVRGEGAFDYEASRGRLEVDAGALLPGSRLELRAVGSELYVRVPPLLAAWLPSAKPWVSLAGGRSLDALGLGELRQDPGELLGLLRASSTRVTKAGTAVVRGVETTRYTAVLDPVKALEANADALGLSAAERAQLRRAADELRRLSGRSTQPVNVFVDEDGLVRRLTLAADGDRVSIDFWDFGTDVDVQAPPASAVFDLDD